MDLPKEDRLFMNNEEIKDKRDHDENNSQKIKTLSDSTNIEVEALTVHEEESNLSGNNSKNIVVTVYTGEDSLAASKHLEELAPGEEAEREQQSQEQIS
ncbi:hypothetical protein RDI58_024060 [Solanum bulbocastanum]|uniref:Uncharacterized protein n=1 Tax=Solanum bulbocastanum TaxID=147425 RepID=A0AAN8Y585_SOLBU